MEAPPYWVRFYSASELAEELERIRPPEVRYAKHIRKTYVIVNKPLPLGSAYRNLKLILSTLLQDNVIGKALIDLGGKEFWNGRQDSIDEAQKAIDEKVAECDAKLEEIFSEIPHKWIPGEYVSAAEEVKTQK